jgi:hypothetical protein
LFVNLIPCSFLLIIPLVDFTFQHQRYSWIVDTFFRDSDIAKLLQLGIHRQGQNDITAADTRTGSNGGGRDDRGIRGGNFIDVETDSFERRN